MSLVAWRARIPFGFLSGGNLRFRVNPSLLWAEVYVGKGRTFEVVVNMIGVVLEGDGNGGGDNDGAIDSSGVDYWVWQTIPSEAQ